MMTFIGLCGEWRVALSDENSTAAYPIQNWLEWSEPASDDGPRSAHARAVIEIHRFLGGMSQRAMIGGEIRVKSQATSVIRVGWSGELTLGAAKTCQSELSGALAPGLPSEFAQAALDGIIRVPDERRPGSVIIIDRAGYDEVDSSSVAFELAGGLLLVTLTERLRGMDLMLSTLEKLAKQRGTQ
jgi:hypothetical protein